MLKDIGFGSDIPHSPAKVIVVLMGSTNRNGSTGILVDNFKRGAEENGHSVEVIDVCHRMDAYYDTLTPDEQEAFKNENGQGAFDLTPMDNDWMTRGRWIQATVWELRKEMIRDVRFFVTGKYKRR